MGFELKNTIPFWEDANDPLAWDTVIIADCIFPGVVTVGGAGLKRKLDIKSAKGSDGATLTDNGIEPGKLTVELLIYNNYDWEQLQGLLPIISPRKKGGTRQATTIFHPLCSLLNITKIYIDSVPFPEFDKRNQFLRFKFTAVEWFPAPKPVKKPSKKVNDGKSQGTAGDQSDNGFAGDDEEAAEAFLCNTFPHLPGCGGFFG